MSKTMKGVSKQAPGYDQMEFIDLAVPEATEDKVLIKVAYTGICGSDIHTFKGEYKNPTTPVVLGTYVRIARESVRSKMDQWPIMYWHVRKVFIYCRII